MMQQPPQPADASDSIDERAKRVRALRAAMRLMESRANFLRDLAEHFRERRLPRQAAYFEDCALEAEGQAAVLRELTASDTAPRSSAGAQAS